MTNHEYFSYMDSTNTWVANRYKRLDENVIKLDSRVWLLRMLRIRFSRLFWEKKIIYWQIFRNYCIDFLKLEKILVVYCLRYVFWLHHRSRLLCCVGLFVFFFSITTSQGCLYLNEVIYHSYCESFPLLDYCIPSYQSISMTGCFKAFKLSTCRDTRSIFFGNVISNNWSTKYLAFLVY